VETAAGPILPELQADGQVRVDMGPPFLEPDTVPTHLPKGPAGLPQGKLSVLDTSWAVAAAGMGNPHVVVPVPDVMAMDLEAMGAALEVHPVFPARTNVHLVQVLSPSHLLMRVWERGAGPTLACGTGACATLVACHLLGLSEREARLDLPGGPLDIAWDGTTNHVFMTGPAEQVFDGQLAEPLARELATALGLKGWESSTTIGSSLSSPADPIGAVPARAEDPDTIDCATACTQGCQRPQACPSAEARAKVAALLEGSSLDDLVRLANDSLESRLLGRRAEDGWSSG
jgi:diaminopimelate epimerase